MLVLTRHKDEKVIVTTPEGRRIVVAVVDIRGDKIRLGFEADADVTLHREEVAEAIRLQAEGEGEIGPAEAKRRMARDRGTPDRPRPESAG